MTQIKEKTKKKKLSPIGIGRLVGLLAWPAFAILFRNHVWAFWGGLAISECVCYSIGYIIWRIRPHREIPLPLLLRKDLLSIFYAAFEIGITAFNWNVAFSVRMFNLNALAYFFFLLALV